MKLILICLAIAGFTCLLNGPEMGAGIVGCLIGHTLMDR